MAYTDKQGYWVVKVMIDGQSYTERTELRGGSQKVEKEAKRLQDDFKRRMKDQLAKQQAGVKRDENGDVMDQRIGPAFRTYYDQQGQYAKGHASKDIDRDLTWVAANLGVGALVSGISTRKLIELREIRRVMPKRGVEGNDPISGRTCNATFERLKFCLNWLKETGYTVPEIAWKRVWVEENPRETVFTVGMARLLFSTIREDYRDCLEFAALGGPRRRQFVELKWADINWDRSVITLLRQKKRGAKRKPKPTIIPITTRMRELILRQIDPETCQPYHPVLIWTFVAARTVINRKAKDGFYEEGERYPITYSGLGTFWARWKKANRVTNCRMHDLRHAAGTLLEDTVNDTAMVQQMLGHSDRATTELYVHRNVDKLRAAMEATHNAIRLRDECKEREDAGAGKADNMDNESDAEIVTASAV